MFNKLNAEFNTLQTALRVRSQRQELLASNIANADTPQYKARDIDFKSAMQSAMQQASESGPAQQSTGQLQQSNSAHIANGVNSYAGSGDVLFRSLIQGSIDGNTVDMDVERNAFVDNGIRYEAGLTLMSDKVKEIMTAINGQ